MSNNYDNPIILDNASDYFGFIRNGSQSTGPRVHQAANLSAIEGILIAPAGSICLLRDGTGAVNVDGNSNWELFYPQTAGGDQIVTVLTDVSADLEAEATNNIVYNVGNTELSQALPNPATATRNLYRFLYLGNNENGLTLTGTIDGVVTAYLDQSITVIRSGSSWYGFGYTPA